METALLQKYETQGGELLAHARAIIITDGASKGLAVEFTTNARRMVKTIEAEFRPDIDKAHSLHKDLLARLTRLLKPFRDARFIVDQEIGRDFMEREKIQHEEARKAQLEADAEAKRQEDTLAKDAEDYIAEGKLEEAEALLDSEVVVNPSTPVPEVQKTVRADAGSTTVRKDIAVEVVDKRLVLEAVVARTLPETLVTVDVGAAKRYARAGGLTTMPGFRITETAVVSGRVR